MDIQGTQLSKIDVYEGASDAGDSGRIRSKIRYSGPSGLHVGGERCYCYCIVYTFINDEEA